MLVDTMMALWNVTSKNKDTKVLVSFFLLYIGISCLPALMGVAAFSPHSILSQAAITGEHALSVGPSASAQIITTIQAHTAVTPTITGPIATPPVNTGVSVDAKSQAQIGNQASTSGTNAVFHQGNSPSSPRKLPSLKTAIAPTREPEVVPTPIHSKIANPTPTPETQATATPIPVPTSVVPIVPPVLVPTIVPSPPVPLPTIVPSPTSGQNIPSSRHN